MAIAVVRLPRHQRLRGGSPADRPGCFSASMVVPPSGNSMYLRCASPLRPCVAPLREPVGGSPEPDPTASSPLVRWKLATAREDRDDAPWRLDERRGSSNAVPKAPRAGPRRSGTGSAGAPPRWLGSAADAEANALRRAELERARADAHDQLVGARLQAAQQRALLERNLHRPRLRGEVVRRADG